MIKLISLSITLIVTSSVISAQPQKVLADNIVAVVGDRIILQSDIVNSLEQARQQGIELNEDAQCMLMDQALVSKVLMLQAEKDSLTVPDDEIEAHLDRLVNFYIRQLGSKEKVEEYANKSIFQLKEDARPAIHERKLVELMQQKIVNMVKITPAEVIDFYHRM